MKITGGMAARQVARDLEVAPETVNRHVARIARHCMLFHCLLLKDAPPIREVVIDGFESFEYSQYHPIHHHLAVEKDTDFFGYFTDSELRRKGRMSEAQKRGRQEREMRLGKPDPKSIENDVLALLEFITAELDEIVIYSDDHPAYKRSIKRLAVKVEHHITSGKAHRGRDNPLWPINLLDLIIRHNNANHKRETIAWSKRRQASAERLVILLVWRNYVKGRREKVRGSPTPAMARGMLDRHLDWEEIMNERIFRTRNDLPPRWSEYYDRTVSTRAIENERRHELKYAY